MHEICIHIHTHMYSLSTKMPCSRCAASSIEAVCGKFNVHWGPVCACVCMCVCVHEINCASTNIRRCCLRKRKKLILHQKRKKHPDSDRQTDRQRQTARDRQTDRQTETESYQTERGTYQTKACDTAPWLVWFSHYLGAIACFSLVYIIQYYIEQSWGLWFSSSYETCFSLVKCYGTCFSLGSAMRSFS